MPKTILSLLLLLALALPAALSAEEGATNEFRPQFGALAEIGFLGINPSSGSIAWIPELRYGGEWRFSELFFAGLSLSGPVLPSSGGESPLLWISPGIHVGIGNPTKGFAFSLDYMNSVYQRAGFTFHILDWRFSLDLLFMPAVPESGFSGSSPASTVIFTRIGRTFYSAPYQSLLPNRVNSNRTSELRVVLDWGFATLKTELEMSPAQVTYLKVLSGIEWQWSPNFFLGLLMDPTLVGDNHGPVFFFPVPILEFGVGDPDVGIAAVIGYGNTLVKPLADQFLTLGILYGPFRITLINRILPENTYPQFRYPNYGTPVHAPLQVFSTLAIGCSFRL